MRFLSARISRARHLRAFGEVEAVVTLLVSSDRNAAPYVARVLASVPAQAPDAAPLRDRLLASAKLSHIAGRVRPRDRSQAA